MKNPLSDLVIAPVSGALLGILTGWLISLNARPFRILKDHPWRVFWLWGVPPMMGILAFALLATQLRLGIPLAWPPPWYFLYLSFLYLTVLVMALGAIQGLRVTWLRSRWKAILILFFWLAFPLVETFSISRDPADFFGHLYSAISLSPSWGLAAWVTHRVARRLASPQDRSVVTADAVATDLGERASGLKHANIPELILLTVITLGLYYPVWFLRRRPRLNELESRRKLGRWPFVFALLFGSLRLLVSGGGPKVSQLESTAESLAFSLFTFGALAVTILMVVQCFFVKDMIEDHLAGAQEDAVLQRNTYESVKLSSVLTLCFGIFYLQYKINQRLVAVQNGLTRR